MSFNPGSTLTPSQDDPLEDSVLPATSGLHGVPVARPWPERTRK